MIYGLSILATIVFVVYSKWQFSDDRGDTSGKWHPWGMGLRILLFVIPYIMQHYPASKKDYFLAGAICMIAWEIGINLIALAQKWYYVGTTAKTDIKFRKYHWLFYFGFLFVAILIRIFVK